MTMLTGCFGKSNKEIVDNFNDFITMFPCEDLTYLYDKEPNASSLNTGDLGTWVVSSYKYTDDEKKVGTVLRFNRNTNKAEGEFILRDDINGEATYPIYYDKGSINFVNDNVEVSVKEELSNFNMMYDFITINREYLDSLESTRIFYNGEVPMYGAKYKLTSEDMNIKKIKEKYPDINIDETNLRLSLSGEGTDETTRSFSLEISLDANYDNRFICYINLSK